MILRPEETDSILNRLSQANSAAVSSRPGEKDSRQPVHTVYGGAQLFKAETPARLGAVALSALETYAPDPEKLSMVLGFSSELAGVVHERVVEKLSREPVEDFRIDFEDGFGVRREEEEDKEAVRCGQEVARAIIDESLPPFIGIRVKPLNEEWKRRSVRTLDIFLESLLSSGAQRLPPNFVVTLPKITCREQVSALVEVLEAVESRAGLEDRSLRLELMIETPQSIIGDDGTSPLFRFVEAAEGRCDGAHFGLYDYTASSNITAACQTLDHPSCDYARQVMQTSLAGTGVHLSDGATNVMPVGRHRTLSGGRPLSRELHEENRRAVHKAWKVGYDHIRHSLSMGFYQGWDLHPNQLPIRYAAVYAFFLEGLEAASLRLRTFVERAAQATLVDDVFDDAASGQALLGYFLRGVSCGAFSESEATSRTGLTGEELRTRSFSRILAMRGAREPES